MNKHNDKIIIIEKFLEMIKEDRCIKEIANEISKLKPENTQPDLFAYKDKTKILRCDIVNVPDIWTFYLTFEEDLRLIT